MRSRIILCNISYADIMEAACRGLTVERAAEYLGVDKSGLYRQLKRRGMQHWFNAPVKKYNHRIVKNPVRNRLDL